MPNDNETSEWDDDDPDQLCLINAKGLSRKLNRIWTDRCIADC